MRIICSVNFIVCNNILCHYHGNESLIIKKIFFHNFSLLLNSTCLNDNIVEWIFCEEKETIEGEYVSLLNFSRYFYQIYINFSLSFPPFNTDYQTGRNINNYKYNAQIIQHQQTHLIIH